MTFTWYHSYRAAILETDWTTMQERLQSAELEIHERQRILSLDHGGSPEERQAIADALRGQCIQDWLPAFRVTKLAFSSVEANDQRAPSNEWPRPASV